MNNNEEKMAKVIGYMLRVYEESRKYYIDHFLTKAAENALKRVEDYRLYLKDFLDPDFVDRVFEKEGFPADTDYRKGMIEEIASRKDENWFTREDLRKMPTEWLERIIDGL